MSAPLISIITPSLNGGAYLQHSLSSILSQKGDFDLQCLVIDGGSTDATLPLLQSIKDARLEWISQPDRGQTNAINKGLAMAKGDIVAWLNTDDLYAPAHWQRSQKHSSNPHPPSGWQGGAISSTAKATSSAKTSRNLKIAACVRSALNPSCE